MTPEVYTGGDMAEIVREPTEQNATSRGINVILGIWLFISAFLFIC